MEVILKPTSMCNFNCTFCSAANLKLKHQTILDSRLQKILTKLNPHTIIITGGEPLTIHPQYYEQLLSAGNWNISFTSNLKDFYQNPNKWCKLFRNRRVSVCTSFQYGQRRKWSTDKVYDESMFMTVFNLFKNEIGYRLKFISVISAENEKYAVKHLELAKKLNTICKLNSLMPLGISTDFYPVYKLFKLILDIYDSEYRQYLDVSCYENGICNLNTTLKCENNIRAITIDKNDKLLCSNCEDDLTNGKYLDDITKMLPEQLDNTELVTNECIFCELYYLCNACKQYRSLNKMTHNHCIEMKKLKDRILNANWKIQP